MAEKELLKQYGDLQIEIRDLEKKIIILENKKIKIERDSVKGSSPYFPYEQKNFNIEGYNYPEADRKEMRLIKLNILLNERKDSCEELKLEIEEFINSIPDSRTRRVFQYRYVDCMSWTAIAFRIGKTDESYPRKLIHDKYLENV